MNVDVAIVGGGPAGLAVAIEAARRGLHPVVIERRAEPLDKACGEGLLPAGRRALRALGIEEPTDEENAAPFSSIRYLQEDGTVASGRLPGDGLGIRRVALVSALAAKARKAGAELRHGCALLRFRLGDESVELDTEGGRLRARLLVGADGLGSTVRRLAGLQTMPPQSRRFGNRRHFLVERVGRSVDVHWAEGVEAYVTPTGRNRVGVAFLWDEASLGPMRFSALLAHFPALREQLDGAQPDSEPRGAGPLLQPVRRRVAHRLALVGDAAGYIDALTGEGLSFAFDSAAALGEVLPLAVGTRHVEVALRAYEQRALAAFGGHARFAALLLQLSRRPALRRRVVRLLARHPALFDASLRLCT